MEHPPLIDCHLHVWTRDMPLTDTAWHVPPTDAPFEECVETLDRHGVAFAVIAAASIHGQYNDYSRLAMRRHRRAMGGCWRTTSTSCRTRGCGGGSMRRG
jgi:predicted TIM-barrel fold metal-dependent hydrolase